MKIQRKSRVFPAFKIGRISDRRQNLTFVAIYQFIL